MSLPSTAALSIEITDPGTILLRQVAPGEWVQQGHVTSQHFRPSTKDQGLLSTHDSNKVSPAEAHERYTRQGFESVGVWGVSISECSAQGLRAFEDPEKDDDSHSVIDFTALGTNAARRAGAILANHANERGPLYP